MSSHQEVISVTFPKLNDEKHNKLIEELFEAGLKFNDCPMNTNDEIKEIRLRLLAERFSYLHTTIFTTDDVERFCDFVVSVQDIVYLYRARYDDELRQQSEVIEEILGKYWPQEISLITGFDYTQDTDENQFNIDEYLAYTGN